MRALFRTLVAVLALAGLASVAAGIAVVRAGGSARAPAGALERGVGSLLRELAVSRSGARGLRSPITATPAVLADARRAFALQCASCHGNDGAGAPLGRALHPPVPDLRVSTLDRTEGELFRAIRDGVRGSGMPALGAAADPDADRRAWTLVAFVRHLPELLDAEREEMAALNPRSGAEWEAIREQGGVVVPPPVDAGPHHHGAH